MSLVDHAGVRAEARRLSPLLEGQHAVVITGDDVTMAAAVAVELARVHGATRRVALADLVGDVGPLVEAVGAGPDDDPHGIADSFLYGVSLNKIARPIDGGGGVFVMPSGTEAVALESVYHNERWRRLAAGFQQAGALLLIVAVRDVPGFEALCQYAGTLLTVGDTAPPSLPDVRTLWLAPPPPPPREVRKVARARSEAAVDEGQRQSRLLASLAAAAALVLLGLWAWPHVEARLGGTPEATPAPERGGDRRTGDGRADGTLATDGEAPPSADPPVPVAPAPPMAARDSGPARTRTGPLVVVNPADSAQASAFAVYLVLANSAAEAAPSQIVQRLAAVAMSPVRLDADPAPWYRVTVGAATDSLQATALLTRLREAGELRAEAGSIVRVPYAFRLEEKIVAGEAGNAVARWARRGVRAYALRQTDGSVTLYTGAFQTPAQATLLADSLQGAGIPPMLAYRTGRTF
jgi:hypothetical protein